MLVLKGIHIKWLLMSILGLIFQINAQAEEIYLKNGDRLTGDVIKEDKDSITIKTEAMGEITISRDSLKRISDSGEETLEIKEDVKEVAWQREISFGYNKSSGNTKVSQVSLSVLIKRKIKQVNEFSLKVDAYYSSSNERMDTQKWYGRGRYAFGFGENREWYNFYKFESDHDRFANIDYRIIPAAGIGYWFYALEELKVMAEVGLGLEHTTYRDQTEDSDEIVIASRAFFEKELFGNSKISQDVFLYPAIDDLSIFRLHSETTLETSVNEKLALRLSLINDYNSNSPGSAKKNDVRLISSITYSF